MEENQTGPDWRDQRRQARWERRQQRWERRQQMWGHHGGWGSGGGALFGLLMMLAGGLFLLRNLGLVYFDNFFAYWPLLLIVMGVSSLLNGRGHIFPGLLFLGMGVVFFARNFGYIHGSIGGYIWPIPLIALGASMLLRSLYGPDWWGHAPRNLGPTGGPGAGPGNDMGSGMGAAPGNGPSNPGSFNEDSADYLSASIMFGNIDRRITSQVFQGGRVSVTFAGARIDLREATAARPEIELRAEALFGGIEIWVPNTWEVETRGQGIAGGFENQTHTRTSGEGATRLIVTGSATFGGVVVRS